MALSDLFSRRRKESDSSDAGGENLPPVLTKALPKFLAGLGAREQPKLLDLGPVVGQNVNFFGEQLGCKISIEDIAADIERHAKEGRMDALPAFFATRLPQPDGTFDGILCWDVFDYLDKKSAPALATQLARVLKPDGLLLAIFNASEPKPGPASYTKNIVASPTTLKQRPYPASRGRQKPFLNRDIIRMFEPLRVTEQFLLKTNVREVLLRKPAG
jgi:SAM-dependent methyltransferase